MRLLDLLTYETDGALLLTSGTGRKQQQFRLISGNIP